MIELITSNPTKLKPQFTCNISDWTIVYTTVSTDVPRFYVRLTFKYLRVYVHYTFNLGD